MLSFKLVLSVSSSVSDEPTQKILKVTLFGRSSLSGQNAPGPRPKGRIWNLRSTTAGMIAAAGILVSSQYVTFPLFELTN